MRTLVVIPTYNERENVPLILKDLRSQTQCEMLFIDDQSPDGTGELLEAEKVVDSRLEVIHRHAKAGVGSAHLVGLEYAYRNGFEVLVTMDADLTHSPRDIHRLISNLDRSSVVVGSRFLEGGGLSEWSFSRRAMTHLGHLITLVFLRMPYDASGAFRAYNLTKISPDIFRLIRSQGYGFFVESLKILEINKISISQVPVSLPARTYGHSKMRTKDICATLRLVGGLALRSVFNRRSLLLQTK
jgi:dolichol-phosphate mannosyltransferase